MSGGITDDLNHFIPIQPLASAPDGTIGGLYAASDILDCLDDNDTTNPDILALKNIAEEDNPVVVLCR